MKNGLLLTLKQLIKLGVINFKKKKRRNKSKLSKMREMDAFDKGLNTAVPFNPQTKRYGDFVGSSAPPLMTPYTDNLRLRDSNDNFNTRLLEYKNDLVDQKLLLNDQEQRQSALEKDVDIGRKIIMRELKPITYQPGYVIDDPVDVSQAFGSATFQPQTSQPTTPEPSSAIPQTPRSITEDDFFTSDAEPLAEPPQKNKPIPVTLYDDTESDDNVPIPPVRVQKRKTQPRTKPRTRQGVSFLDEEENELTSEETAKVGAGGGGNTSMNFPNEPVPKHDNYPFSPLKIPLSKTKPSASELQQWKEWYLLLGLKDSSILQTNRRSDYIKFIKIKLLDEYKQLRGEKDPAILNSKDPREIYKATKNKMLGVK